MVDQIRDEFTHDQLCVLTTPSSIPHATQADRTTARAWPGEPSSVSAAFAPRAHLATSGYKTVVLWDVVDPRRPRWVGDPLTGNTDAVSAAAIVRTGRSLATTSSDKTVVLWM